MINIIKRQINDIKQGGIANLFKKLKLALYITPLFILAIPTVMLIRFIKPWLLVRIGSLNSTRIGHFAANTELYLCEQDAGLNVPKQRYVNLFYLIKPICNHQLATMWKRVMLIWPVWILAPIDWVNRAIPGGRDHQTGDSYQGVFDVHNLLDRFSSHLQFTDEENVRGETDLLEMGIPTGTPFVCLIVRDSAYLDSYQPTNWNYHNYRDSDINNYMLAAEELVQRGYYVIRMGVKVHQTIKPIHPNIIDYFLQFHSFYFCYFFIRFNNKSRLVSFVFKWA